MTSGTRSFSWEPSHHRPLFVRSRGTAAPSLRSSAEGNPRPLRILKRSRSGSTTMATNTGRFGGIATARQTRSDASYGQNIARRVGFAGVSITRGCIAHKAGADLHQHTDPFVPFQPPFDGRRQYGRSGICMMVRSNFIISNRFNRHLSSRECLQSCSHPPTPHTCAGASPALPTRADDAGIRETAGKDEHFDDALGIGVQGERVANCADLTLNVQGPPKTGMPSGGARAAECQAPATTG